MLYTENLSTDDQKVLAVCGSMCFIVLLHTIYATEEAVMLSQALCDQECTIQA